VWRLTFEHSVLRFGHERDDPRPLPPQVNSKKETADPSPAEAGFGMTGVFIANIYVWECCEKTHSAHTDTLETRYSFGD
jgi:hypothetical protein